VVVHVSTLQFYHFFFDGVSAFSHGVRSASKRMHVFSAEHELVATKRTLHREFWAV
jgi:hypothetical protein